jgi:hypothetical protein
MRGECIELPSLKKKILVVLPLGEIDDVVERKRKRIRDHQHLPSVRGLYRYYYSGALLELSVSFKASSFLFTHYL